MVTSAQLFAFIEIVFWGENGEYCAEGLTTFNLRLTSPRKIISHKMILKIAGYIMEVDEDNYYGLHELAIYFAHKGMHPVCIIALLDDIGCYWAGKDKRKAILENKDDLSIIPTEII